MIKYINKLESWEGWSQFLTPKDTNANKVSFGFIDSVVAGHVKHKNPLGYNTEGDLHQADLIEYFHELDAKHQIEFVAKLEYTYYANPEKANVEGDWGSPDGDGIEITLHDLTKCKNPIGKEFLANDYTVLLIVRIEDYGPQQYILG